MEYLQSAVESVRPPFYTYNNYGFLWIYLAGLLLLCYVCKWGYAQVSQKFTHSNEAAFSKSMHKKWSAFQEELDNTLEPAEEAKTQPERPQRPPSPKDSPRPTPNVYRPSIRDRYSGIFRRTG